MLSREDRLLDSLYGPKKTVTAPVVVPPTRTAQRQNSALLHFLDQKRQQIDAWRLHK
jgi:hypothetical protein